MDVLRREYFSKGNVEVSDLQKKLADEFSAIENKPVTIAYLVAGLVAGKTLRHVRFEWLMFIRMCGKLKCQCVCVSSSIAATM